MRNLLSPTASMDYQMGDACHDMHSPAEGGTTTTFSDRMLVWSLLPLVSFMAFLIFLLDTTISLATARSSGKSREGAWQPEAEVSQASYR